MKKNIINTLAFAIKMDSIKLICARVDDHSKLDSSDWCRKALINIISDTESKESGRNIITSKIFVNFSREGDVFLSHNFPNFYLTLKTVKTVKTVDEKEGTSTNDLSTTKISSVVLEYDHNLLAETKIKIKDYDKKIDSLRRDRELVLELLEAIYTGNNKLCDHLRNSEALCNFEFELQTETQILHKIEEIGDQIKKLINETNDMVKTENEKYKDLKVEVPLFGIKIISIPYANGTCEYELCVMPHCNNYENMIQIFNSKKAKD